MDKSDFNFIYYYSTHADYQHPEKEAFFQPALKGRLDLSNPNMREHRSALVNRYRNSIHFIDSQVKLLVQSLKEDGIWDNTIFVFTGDHGEEFYENNKLGHNSALNRFQTQVPFILHIPGKPALRLEKATSHTDVFQTVLQELGAPDNFLHNNFQGINLFSKEAGSVFIGMAHYQRPEVFAIVDGDTKTLLEIKDALPLLQGTTDLDENPIPLPDGIDLKVINLLQQLQHFRKQVSVTLMGN